MNRIWIRLAILMLLGFAAGCQVGGGQLTGASLRVDFDGLTLDGTGLAMSLLVLNPNDHTVVITGASLSFALEGGASLSREIQLDLDISPRNRERIRVRLPADQPVLALLETLDEGTRTRLAYVLDVKFQVQDSRQRESRFETFLHLVPGQPGRYR